MENLSFGIKENSFVAIMGESGAGKSTILNLIFRLYDP
jgi:ABC-type multidrug transport system fused ATPase/permease subunit